MAAVVLALTGFSSGRHHSSGRHKSSSGDDSGGGCSSSRQNHDSYTPRRTTSTYGSTHSSSTRQDGTAVLASCATKTVPYATVEVTNPNTRQTTFEVRFAFQDATGKALRSEIRQITVPSKGTSDVVVKASQAVIAESDHCWVDPVAPVTG